MAQPETYQALARKWRPQTFDDVIGQPQVIQALKNAITFGRIHHAYLFCGPRGTGKTTTARILAKALNCVNGPTATPCNQCPSCLSITNGTNLDVMEIDAASNTGVDDVRELRDSSRYVPAGARFKIYIIDEVHRLSKPAFDALLKTLEEPPASVKFIFATTEVHEVPATVRSRALRFDFHLVGHAELRDHLAHVAAAEQMTVEPAALDLIATEASGSLRDSQSLLDQIAAYAGGAITADLVNDALGLVDASVLFDFTDAVNAADSGRALAVVGQVSRAGRDLGQFVRLLCEHLKRLLFARSLGEQFADETLSADQRQRYLSAAAHFAENDLLRLLLMAVEVSHRARKGSPQPRLEIEMFAMRAAALNRSIDIRALVERIENQTGTLGPFGGSVPSATLVRPEREEPPPVPKPEQRIPESTDDQSSAQTTQAQEARGNGKIDFGPILESICQRRPSLRAVLGQAELVKTGPGTFELNVYQGSTFHQRQLGEKSIRDLIHAEIARTVGAGARVTTHVREGAPAGAQPSTAVSQAAAADRERALGSDHGLQEILRRFDGEIVA
ncbi:MAG: DNA polymerase III subunit gamma/tau [candidate division Zixibacteria bacterium]|nr:DNA polymerase III subunit gamma/tau [candidate division Zixibacteria bacterium]